VWIFAPHPIKTDAATMNEQAAGGQIPAADPNRSRDKATAPPDKKKAMRPKRVSSKLWSSIVRASSWPLRASTSDGT